MMSKAALRSELRPGKPYLGIRNGILPRLYPAEGLFPNLSGPRGLADDFAEIDPLESRFPVGDHVRIKIAEGGLRFVFNSVVKRLDDALLEMFGARMRP